MTSKSKTNAYRYCAAVANELESKWQLCWAKDKTYEIGNPGEDKFDESKPKFYCLDMFPYPSGAGLHVGHPVGYIGSDILCRFKRMQGFNVLHPMGWDAFGLPAEQYAIETGVHPEKTTSAAIDTYRKQLQRIGFSFDWSRELATNDPKYYKWTQWIWLKAYNSWYDPAMKKARPIESLIDQLESGKINPEGSTWNQLDQQSKSKYIDDYRLAYLGKQVVNWCPKLGTVLANEEVVDGVSERGGHPVVRRPLLQWMFRITAFADRLLDGLRELDWPASTIRMQEEWIGRSEGADINFSVIQLDSSIRVYTTRPDTLFGVTFMALAPEHPLVEQLVATPPSGCNSEAIAKYVAQAKSRSDVDRMANSKEKTGVNTGLTAMNPATGKDIPIWIADYVLMGYGHGAIMAVPGHDQRDHDFAIVHNIPIVEVIKSSNEKSENDCISGKGTAINSSSDLLAIDGLQTDEAIDAVISWLEKNNIGKAKTNYKLRDWLFSRQRYWGEPFPIVFDECGKHYPVPESELPITLPDIDDYTPPETDDPTPLLAKANTWLHTTAGQAGIDPSILESNMPVTREANTMPGWAGSCWYALRFCSPHNDKQLVDKDAEKYWMGDGVDLYIGGAEHAVLHLLYARFWHKFLYDLKEISCDEPFRKLFHQGLLTSFAYQRKNKSLVAADAVEERNGQYVESETGEKVERIIAKMSKSLRNVVNPDDIIEEYGADTLRLYEMYMGPLEASAPWNTRDIIGVHRFLQRVWRLGIDEDTGELRSVLNNKLNEVVERALHATIAKVSEDIPKLSHNTAIASMIEFVNTATSEGEITKDQLNRFVCILSPFAPHIAQEMYMKISGEGYITQQPWPAFDPKQLLADVVEMPVQIMGKVRGRISVPTGSTDEEVEQIAINDEHIKRLLENLTVEKIVIVQNKIINIVAK